MWKTFLVNFSRLGNFCIGEIKKDPVGMRILTGGGARELKIKGVITLLFFI